MSPSTVSVPERLASFSPMTLAWGPGVVGISRERGRWIATWCTETSYYPRRGTGRYGVPGMTESGAEAALREAATEQVGHALAWWRGQ